MDRTLHMPVAHRIITQSAKMQGTIIILYFLGSVAGQISKNVADKVQQKIVGGQPIDIKDRPFMLSLHDSRWGFGCGASILSRTWGITALHCLNSVSSRYYVRAGSNRTYKGGSVHRVTNIHKYNGTYVPGSSLLLYDIALFEVRPSFRFSRTIQPVHLPKLTNELPRELFVCGWGSTGIIGLIEKRTKPLMGVSISHVPFETCVKTSRFYEMFLKDDYHLCYGTKGKDACYGDSGGALADRTTIYGIVSFGNGCGQVPGVYVKVSYHLDWIKNIMKL